MSEEREQLDVSTVADAAAGRQVFVPGEVKSDRWQGRHPSVAHFKPLFEYSHLPGHLQIVSSAFADTAYEMLRLLDDGPELSAGLRKLVEAKDCAVRQAVLDRADYS